MSKLNWNYPTNMWVGENRINDLSIACKDLNIKKPLLVTDSGLVKADITFKVLDLLKKDDISVSIFSNVVGNPTGTNVNDGVEFFKNVSDCKLISEKMVKRYAPNVVEGTTKLSNWAKNL